MSYSQLMTPGDKTDEELVADTLAGNRNAFAEIVRRYQALVCALAYSATGDLVRSEDLAQDTFFAVWRQLSELREPGKLRAWVYGIARNRIQDSIRSHYREPTHKAYSLDVLDTAPAPEAQPSDQAVRKDEAAIVWRALEQIPEAFREPLILYHRQNQSVAQVAVLLDLSEDTVKQRLVRGRKLLKAGVAEVVEGALQRTAPGAVFTANVMMALPAGSVAAAKAATGTAVAKGLMGGGIGGVLAAILNSPVPAVGAILFDRQRMLENEAAASALNEREILAAHRRTVMRLLATCALILTILSAWSKGQNPLPWYSLLIPVVTVVPLLLAVGIRVAITRCNLARIWADRGESPVQRSWEYRSAWHLLGRPFVHIRLGFDSRWTGADQPVRAWIAVGHIAYGRLFAWGYVAIAPVSVGCLALGIVSVGFFAIAPVALGMVAAGIYAVGGIAVGWMASGMIAIGINAACGLGAYARNFAMGPLGKAREIACAIHANDAAARDFFAHNTFFTLIGNLFRGGRGTAIILFAASLPFVMWEIAWEKMKGRPAKTR
jgi:RNA polymerase sigma factor (sigma-70 family)